MTRIGCDVAVVGGGVFGMASALELARRGTAVVVLDRFGPGHPATSSTGASRSIRAAYGEPFYVALAHDALERWAALESATGLDILHLPGRSISSIRRPAWPSPRRWTPPGARSRLAPTPSCEA